MRNKPLVPMGAITGHPTRAELRAMLDAYRAGGIDQYMIYPRSGLAVEYMGKEWLEICRHIFEYAAEFDMAIWIYDDYNWPSGSCRGKVIRKNPMHACKKLVAFTESNSMGASTARGGQGYYWTVMSIPLYANLLDPEATRSFLAHTHEVYYEQFSEYFGSTIRGFFTDEPSFTYALKNPVRGSLIELPYYEGLREDYQQMTGRALLADTEQHLDGKTPEGMWEDYYALMGRRFKESFFDIVRSWCDAHHVLFSGHLLAEEHPGDAITHCGCPVKAMRAFSMPGMDEIFTRSDFEKIEWGTLKLLESAMQESRTDAFAELFALGPSDMTHDRMRMMIYLAALHGVNHFLTAVSPVDARGNVEKPYYYNPVTPTQPWFRYMDVLSADASDAAELAAKTSTARIAVRYPQTLYSAKPQAKQWDASVIDFNALLLSLVNAQWEFRILGEEEFASDIYEVVLQMNDAGVCDTFSSTQFSEVDALLAFLEKTLTRRASLRYEDGALVENIFLRTFDDSSVCVVNTAQTELRLVMLDGDVFDLPLHGIYVSDDVQESHQKTYDLNAHRYTATLEAQNTQRCLFDDNGECVIDCSAPLHVSVVLREYGGEVTLCLDDTPLDGTAACDSLPLDLRALYRQTKEKTLDAGRHVLRLTNAATDLPYLPLAFVAGDFALGADGILRPESQQPATIAQHFSGQLREYAGTVVFQTRANLEEYDSVQFAHEGMALELILGDESQGARLWAPFTWSLPEKWRRKDVPVTLRVATSVGPLFGNYPDHCSDEQPGFLGAYWPQKNRTV